LLPDRNGRVRLTYCIDSDDAKLAFWHHGRMSLDAVIKTLEQSLAALPQGGVVVAFSGGMDSSVLLHAFANMPGVRAHGLRALHVDHGLHQDSASWAERCFSFAERLEVPIDIQRVNVERSAGTGPEDVARSARFAAFEASLRDDERLALGHHRDDQAETVLLKLLRGAGPEGLGAMRHLRHFGKGYLWRPLLDVPRSALRDYAQRHSLHWIDDPSNENTHLRRNYLRTEIIPRLQSHWPHVDAALAHSAQWLRAASDFINAHAVQALARLRGSDPSTLQWREWLDLPHALRDPVLRMWLRDLKLPEPSHFHQAELERQLRCAADDKNPCVRWDGAEVRRFRALIYAMPPLQPVASDWETLWDGSTFDLPGGGRLSLEPAASVALTVRYRRGGETLVPSGGRHHRDLRVLLQENGIPSWQRARLPLIYSEERLLAVADLLLSEEGRAWCASNGTRFIWQSNAGRYPIASVALLS
jgi:tRNA(Ile)-lysidine synthase